MMCGVSSRLSFDLLNTDSGTSYPARRRNVTLRKEGLHGGRMTCSSGKACARPRTGHRDDSTREILHFVQNDSTETGRTLVVFGGGAGAVGPGVGAIAGFEGSFDVG